MLINRYFSRELINYLLAVTLIVLVIFLGNQLIRYLNDAAAGNMALAVVGKLLLLEIPYLLALLLPVTFFIALMLVLGRISADHELIVLKACGFSPWQQWKMISVPCLFVVFMITILVFWVQPQIASYRNQLLATTNAGASIDTLVPGKFQAGLGGRYVFYVENISVDHKHLHNIFVAERRQNIHNDPQWNVIKAQEGLLVQDVNNQAQFIQIANGNRYVGDAGARAVQIMMFGRYLILTQSPHGAELSNQTDTYTNGMLINLIKVGGHTTAHRNLAHLAASELEWRFSLPLSCLMLAIVASLFGGVPPRYGRYARLVPGILFLIIYINLLLVARSFVSDGVLSAFPGIFSVSFSLMLMIVLYLVPWRYFWRKRQSTRGPSS